MYQYTFFFPVVWGGEIWEEDKDGEKERYPLKQIEEEMFCQHFLKLQEVKASDVRHNVCHNFYNV